MGYGTWRERGREIVLNRQIMTISCLVAASSTSRGGGGGQIGVTRGGRIDGQARKIQLLTEHFPFVCFQEKTDDAKKAKKEENGDGDEEDEDLDEEEIEEYNLDYNDDEEIDGEGELCGCNREGP